MQGLSVKYKYWTDMDFTTENPSLIQIVELPPAITQPMFTFANTGNKKYITIDYGRFRRYCIKRKPYDLANRSYSPFIHCPKNKVVIAVFKIER